MVTQQSWFTPFGDEFAGDAVVTPKRLERFLSAYQRLYCAGLSSVYVLAIPAMYQAGDCGTSKLSLALRFEISWFLGIRKLLKRFRKVRLCTMIHFL